MNNSLYEDYMRSVLGYDSMNYRNTYDMNYDNMMFNNMSNFSNMQNEDLEECYPDIYRMVYPMIQNACIKNTRPITKELVDSMTDEIYFAIEDNEITESREKESTTTPDSKKNNLQSEDRQRTVRNRNLNDLIRILLLRELLGKTVFLGGQGRPPFPRPPRPSMRPPMPPRPRPRIGPFNRKSYEQFDNLYDIYEY